MRSSVNALRAETIETAQIFKTILMLPLDREPGRARLLLAPGHHKAARCVPTRRVEGRSKCHRSEGMND